MGPAARTVLFALALGVFATLAPAAGWAAVTPLCSGMSEAYSTSLAAYRAEIAANPPRAATVTPKPEEGDGARPADQLKRAEEKLKESMVKSGRKSAATASAWLEKATRHREMAQYALARDALNNARTALPAANSRSELAADIEKEVGVVLSRERDSEGALVAFDKAIEIFTEVKGGESMDTGLAYRTRADILRSLNRFSEALGELSKAEAIFSRALPAAGADLAETLTDKSIIYARLNDRPSALKLATEAARIAVAQRGPANRASARALHNVGISQRRLGSYAAAFEAFARVYAIYTTPGPASRIRAAEVVEDVSSTYSFINCFDEAIASQIAARTLYEEHYNGRHDRIAAAEHRLGALYRDAGRREEGLTVMLRAAAMYDDVLGPENARTAVVYSDIAAVHSLLGHREEAVDFGLRTIRILSRSKAQPDKLRLALLSFARVLNAQGNRPAAIMFAKMAVNKQQEIRALNKDLSPELAKTFAERYREYYMYLASLLIEDGRWAEAQAALDLIKGQEVMDFVRGGNPKLMAHERKAQFTPSENATSAQIEKLLARPLAVSKELDQLAQIAKQRPLSPEEQARKTELTEAYKKNYKSLQEDLKGLLETIGGQTSKVQGEVVALHLDMVGQTQRKLAQFKGRAALMQVASLDKAVHIFITTPKAAIHREVPVSRADLGRLAFDAWSSVSHREDVAVDNLTALYNILIRPVEQDLADTGADVLMLNLEGFLRYVPYAALFDGKHFLVEKYALTMQTPAAETVYAMGDRDKSRAVGFGVTEAHSDFSALPGVADELESIFAGTDQAGIFDGSPRMNAEFDESSLATALESSPLFIHLASHFKLTPGDESKSFLLLGNGSPLSLETLRTDARFQFLSVDLLTLSACETAGQVGADGNEVESFATLAQGRGASSVVATLWPIADKSTAVLMSGFYRGMLDDEMDKATALRRAQMEMIRGQPVPAEALSSRGMGQEEAAGQASLSHPYYWSAFMLLGNWL